ncbi:MAG: hypothetical protein Q8N44_12115 [Rubrivivax sp.]|nr:hypothetical protein [Rubrivivax sp.]
MNTTERLQIASRIHQRLRRELGQGIDAERLLADRLYARDVLLVCQALGGELATLAQQLQIDKPQPGGSFGSAPLAGAVGSGQRLHR